MANHHMDTLIPTLVLVVPGAIGLGACLASFMAYCRMEEGIQNEAEKFRHFIETETGWWLAV